MPKFGTPVAAVAVLWVGFEFVNIVWPRTVSESWYMNWAFFVAMGAILALGAVIVKVRGVGKRPLNGPGGPDGPDGPAEPVHESRAELV